MDIRRGGSGGPVLPSMALLRELTDQIVLDTVFEQAPITRAEIAQTTGISKTTVSESVRRLEKSELLITAGEQRGRQGRVGTYYQVAPTAGFVMAVDLHPAGIRLLAADLFGRTFAERDAPPPAQRGEPAAIAEQLRALVSRVAAEGERGHGRLLAAGVSVANPVDPASSRVIPLADTPYPGGVFQPQEALAGVSDAPLLVENDVNLAAVAERWHGAARTADSFAYIYIGAGMGMGVMLGDELLRGARGMAGEIGYLAAASQRTEQGGSRRHGFADAVAAGFAGAGGRRSGEQDLIKLAADVCERAEKGDAQAQAALQQEGQTIGEAVADVCSVLDPQLVLLGGPIGSHPALLAPVRETVAELAPLPPPIESGALGPDASLDGALGVALRRARADLLSRAAKKN